MSFPSGHALLIGVGTYQHHRHLNLPVTAEDARSLGVLLRDPAICGYPREHVAVLRDEAATHTGILAALATLAATTTAESTVLIYYAGHGHYDHEQQYYLTSHDTQLADGWVIPGTAMPQDVFIRALQAIPAKRLLLLINACHAGELSPTLAVTQEPPLAGSNPPALTAAALLSSGEGRILITACRANQLATTGNKNTTLFARAVAAALQGEDIPSRAGGISAFDLYTSVYTRVEAEARTIHHHTQEPELTILKGVGPFIVALAPRQAPPSTTPPRADPVPTTPTVQTIESAASVAAFTQIVGEAPMNTVGDTNANETTTTGDNAAIDQRRVGVDLSGSTNHGPVNISGIVMGNQITNTITITPEAVAKVDTRADLLALLDQLKQDVSALQGVDEDTQGDAVGDIEKAKAAGEKGKMERLIEKLGNVKNVMLAFAANVPVAHQLGQTIGEIIQKANLLK